MHRITIHHNDRAARRTSYAFQSALNIADAERARSLMSRCPRYVRTPLVALDGVARSARVASVLYKDEASRLGLGSFKALGGAYAVAMLLVRLIAAHTGRRVDVSELVDGVHSELTRSVTVACASDGNHGRSVAAGARIFGCNCTIFLHEGVSEGREAAIRALGASVVRTPGTYDDSVAAARDAARERGWHLVSDTTAAAEDGAVAATVMNGYAVLVLEIFEHLHERGEAPLTHVFLQGGVGGLAAAVVAHFWEALGDAAPTFVVVEPERADCLFQSAVAGAPMPARGDLNTVMAGLSCGEVSYFAWPILHAAAEFFMTVPDEAAIECMRLLALGVQGDPPIVAGESAVAGLAGLLGAARDPQARAQLKLDTGSRILLIGTEGATDPQLYERLIRGTASSTTRETVQ